MEKPAQVGPDQGALQTQCPLASQVPPFLQVHFWVALLKILTFS